MADDDDRDDEDRKRHPHTDYGLEPTLSALSGSDVVLTGTKSDGSPFRGRLLTNVSFRPNGTSGVFVIGMDPAAKGIRQFDMSRLDSVSTREGLVMDRQEVLAVLDRCIEALRARTSSEGGPHDPKRGAETSEGGSR